MHNLTKIKIFRTILWIIYPIALLLIYPFSLLKKKNKGRLIFFFDRYCIGGAQRIHLDILKSIPGRQKRVYFTRKSPNAIFKDEFYTLPGTYCSDVHFWCDNLLFRLFTVHFYAFYINRHSAAHIFSSNSTFFYDLLPFLKKKIVTTELLHNFTYGKKGMEFFGLASYQYLNNRIVYDTLTLVNIKKQYAEYGIDGKFLQRILFIEPGVEVPPVALPKNYSLPLKILYAGRGGPQKRVWLLNRIAEYFVRENLPVEFHFAGPILNELSAITKEHSVIYGEVGNSSKMNEIYEQCHAIILTSAYEGFPMVIKEGMARSCIPIVTALGGNKMHLTTGENALLIDAVDDEEAVVREGIQQIKLLLNDGAMLQKLSEAAHEYAKKQFGKEKFSEAYRNLLV